MLRGGEVAGFAYVDDSGLVGLSASTLDRLHARYQARTEAAGFALHTEKSHGAQLEDIKFGFAPHGTSAALEPKQERWITLDRALKEAYDSGRITWDDAQRFLQNPRLIPPPEGGSSPSA